MQEIFAFKQTGVDESGKIIGAMKPTGSVPTWIDQLKSRGIELDMGMFSE
jgi:pilus assembly protein CpaF